MTAPLAPIVLFTYNRPDHTSRTLKALAANELANQSKLIIYSDGPRSEKDIPEVESCRALFTEIDGFASVEVHTSDKNKGLAASVIEGVTATLEQFENVIVLEDDLVSHPYFLRYMNHHLNRYKDEGDVISIHGYLSPIDKALEQPFFIRGADCWGWATWRRGWQVFERDAQVLYDRIATDDSLRHTFDMQDSYHYTRMLREQIDGEIDSWAIRWHASAFLENKLTLYPPSSLIRNIGMDGSGTHKDRSSAFHSELDKIELDQVLKSPSSVKEDPSALASLIEFKRSIAPSLWEKIRYNIGKRIRGRNKSKL